MKKGWEKGSITVEAALFLPLFLFAFLSIYNLIHFTRAQLIMQYAADQAAKEVAQYSYLLEKTGILEQLDNLEDASIHFEEDLKAIEMNLDTIQAASEEALRGENVVQNGIEAGEALKDAYDTVQTYIDDPSKFIEGVLSAYKRDEKDGISRYIVNEVAKSCVMKQLSIAGGNNDPTAYQKSLGVSNLTMSRTSWCENKTRDIRIVIDFDVENKIPFFIMEPRSYRVCASTRVWSGV